MTHSFPTRRSSDLKALENGSGPWLSQAYWVAGLAAWRQNDCQAAASAFENVAARADNDAIRAGGFFWAARSYMVCGNAPKVAGLMPRAARLEETFYGLIAPSTLVMPHQMKFLHPPFYSTSMSPL